LKIFGILKWR